MRPYQLEGLNWLIKLYEHGINGILADEMGLGKTVQSVSFLHYLHSTQGLWGPFLVVAPLSSRPSWLGQQRRRLQLARPAARQQSKMHSRARTQQWQSACLCCVSSPLLERVGMSHRAA